MAKKRARKKVASGSPRRRSAPKTKTIPDEDSLPTQLDLVPGRDDVPSEVKNAANAYKAACIAKANASTKHKTKQDNLIAVMKENNVPQVKLTFEGTTKIFYLHYDEKIKERKPEAPPKAE